MTPEKQQPGSGGARREADIYDLLAWLEVNKVKVAVIAGILILIGFAVMVVRYNQEQKELKASTALLELRPTLTPQTNRPAIEPAAFTEVAENFSGTRAAERARFLAASALFAEGNYAEAAAAFSEFKAQNADSPWAAAAALGEAAALEAQEKVDEAFAAYQQVASQYASSAVVDDAKLALARIHEQRNEPEQALRIYNEMAPAPVPGTAPAPSNPEAMARKAALLKLHPELDPDRLAPAPVAPLTAPASTNAPAPAATNEPAAEAPAATNEAPRAAATEAEAPEPEAPAEEPAPAAETASPPAEPEPAPEQP